jgi:hypothetical protein
MFRPYVQETADWIKYYDTTSKSNKDSGESLGGIGADSGSVANPVEKAVTNNTETINSKMRQGELSSALPSDRTVVAQTVAKARRRRKRTKVRRRKPGSKRKKVKKGGKRRRKVTKKRSKKKKRSRKKKKPKQQRDLFDP